VTFWDSSALVPLVVDESSTPEMRRLLSRDRDVVVWMMTSVEILSALGRVGRMSPELADLLPGTRADVMALVTRCATVTDVDAVRRRAERLVSVHPLTAADAQQLGAAVLASGDRPETLAFVTLDQQLARCAKLEGFRVVTG
jgi:uncharacterized protein